MRWEGTMETVCILMSTYNGEKYITEQLNSLLRQKDVNVDIIIRDDGSTDNTVKIVQQYEKYYENIKFFTGENIGYERSFYFLMKWAGNYDYYAFSDQDDVWDKDKLISAIDSLEKKDMSIPIVYWCNLKLVDAELNFIHYMTTPDDSDFKKGRYIIDKYGYGCTMVFNKALRDLAIKYEPKSKISHDNWVGLLGIFLGNYIFDNNTYISYRQHGNNVIGGDNRWLGTWKRRIKNLKNIKQYSRALIAQEILNGYRDLLNDDDIRILSVVACYKQSFKKKMELIRAKEIRRASKEKDIWFKVMIIFSLA